MSLFWSLWVTLFSIGCWLFILAVLWFTLRYRPTIVEDGTTGHVYDGIAENDGPLPKWWLVVFWATLIWGLGYFVLYPSIMPERWAGVATVNVDGKEVPWTSANQLASDLKDNSNTFNKTFNDKILQDPAATAQLAELDKLQQQQFKNAEPNADLQKQIDEKIAGLAPIMVKLSSNQQANKIGQRLFLQNCSVCHGSAAHGAKGFPNLTDNDWIYGGNPAKILQTIEHGRVGGMPAWQTQIGEEGVRAAAEYVLSLSPAKGNKANGELDASLVNQGKAIFTTNCAVCHGADAKGNHDVGALNLTDDTWLYGGDRETVRTTIRNGRAGVMPAWEKKLGNEKILLVSSYVYSLSDHSKDAQQVNSSASATATTTTVTTTTTAESSTK